MIPTLNLMYKLSKLHRQRLRKARRQTKTPLYTTFSLLQVGLWKHFLTINSPVAWKRLGGPCSTGLPSIWVRSSVFAVVSVVLVNKVMSVIHTGYYSLQKLCKYNQHQCLSLASRKPTFELELQYTVGEFLAFFWCLHSGWWGQSGTIECEHRTGRKLLWKAKLPYKQ